MHQNIQPNVMGRVPPTYIDYQNIKKDYLKMNLSGSSKYSMTNLPHQLFDSHYARPPNLDEKPSTIRHFDNHLKSVDTSQNLLYDPQYGPYPSTNNPFIFRPSFPPPNYGPNEGLRHSMNTTMDYVSRKRMPTIAPYHQFNSLPEYHESYANSSVKNQPMKIIKDKAPSTYIPHSDIKANDNIHISNKEVMFPLVPQDKIQSTAPIQEATYQRTSVIKSVISSKTKDADQLQIKADLLKFQGSILHHTGKNFIDEDKSKMFFICRKSFQLSC